MLDLKRWERVVHEETGVSFEVKRLNGLEVGAVEVVLGKILSLVSKGAAGTAEDKQAAHEALAGFPEQKIADIFGKYVRNVEGLELDGEAVSDGAQLYSVAPWALVIFVLGAIQQRSGLSVPEGKDSPSPSTSGSGHGASSDSPATPTGGGDGAAPSTATETPSSDESSSRVA